MHHQKRKHCVFLPLKSIQKKSNKIQNWTISQELLSLFSESVATVAKESSQLLPRGSWVRRIHQIIQTHPLFKLNLAKMTFLWELMRKWLTSSPYVIRVVWHWITWAGTINLDFRLTCKAFDVSGNLLLRKKLAVKQSKMPVPMGRLSRAANRSCARLEDTCSFGQTATNIFAFHCLEQEIWC